MAVNDQDVEIDFSRYIAILLRRRWIILLTAVVVLLATVAYAFLATPVFRASTLLNIEQPVKSINSENTSNREQDEDYFDTQYKLMTSESLLQKVYTELKLDQRREFARGLKTLSPAVSVSPVPHTHLCYINADSVDPKLAQQMSAALARRYVQQNLNNQLFMSKNVLEALQMSGDGADSERINASLPTVVNNRLIQSIKEQIFTAEAQLADLRIKYTENHPLVVSLRSRLNQMKATEKAEVDNIVQSLKTDLSGQLQGNNVRIVDPAKIPEHPVRPRRFLAVLFGLFGGLSLGVFAALVVEFLDQTVRTQEDVEERIGLPFLGVIPHARQKKNTKVYAPLLSADVSLTSEAFRNVRTMIGFAESIKGEPVMLVTSSVQEEGKSYVASCLAVVQAQLGQSVLLIDGDLRRPRQHRQFGVSAERGLSDYLAGDIAQPSHIVQATDVPNLSVIACGPRPPNPAELLNTHRTRTLLNWARKYYSRVIIDCPPVFPISDAMLWGRLVKPAVFVMRFGRTRAPLIQAAVARLKNGELKLLGGIVNGARVGTMTYAEGRYYEQYYRDYTDPEPIPTKNRPT